MTTQIEPTTEILDSLDFVPEIPCESSWCEDMHRGIHPASVLAFWSCRCATAICGTRLDEYRAEGEAWCPACNVDPVTIVSTVPIGG